MSFATRTPVRFAHVDAAGIVFYPRYFEMVNAALEDFFADVVGVDFHAMHIVRGLGVPAVKLESEFIAPSRLGDMLDITVSVERLGGSSATLRFDFHCDGRARLLVRCVIVCMDLTEAKSVPWPPEMRERLSPASSAVAADEARSSTPVSGGILSPSDKPKVEEVADGFEPGTLDARG